ncbi:MAG: N-acetylmuramoyl-L-alanine amidase [Pseudoxanthomonas suwonensis]|nr:N-acetylmuramoyl-L-alanine amidase [Pseudoxanthomonas suwonensis]
MHPRTLLAAACLTLLVACAHQPQRNPMATWVASENFDERRPVAIVLHFTQQDSVQESLDTLRTANSQGRVSSHYLVGKDGGIYQLVADNARAWHAGGGRWGTITDLNSASIGIEIDNNGIAPYTEPQIAALIELLRDLTTRLRIPPTQVLGHSDLAPTRKIDPGPHFPWQRLHAAGFGVWPGELQEPPPGFDGWLAMAAVGYPLDDRAAALRAFRMRFRGRDDGGDLAPQFDPEDLRILHALTR